MGLGVYIRSICFIGVAFFPIVIPCEHMGGVSSNIVAQFGTGGSLDEGHQLIGHSSDPFQMEAMHMVWDEVGFIAMLLLAL